MAEPQPGPTSTMSNSIPNGETPGEKPAKQGPPRGPSLHQIHAQPAPIKTFPLPTFYPNNPISLFHLGYAWLGQLLSPPPTEPSVIHDAIWSAETTSVHVTDEKSMRALWEQGFYGKGHLSRSEPNWLKREEVRRGMKEGHVSEVFTVDRREERIRAKWQRAKMEQDMIRETREKETAQPEKVQIVPLVPLAPTGPLELLALPNSLADLLALPTPHVNGHVPEQPKVNGSAHLQPYVRNIPGLHHIIAAKSQPKPSEAPDAEAQEVIMDPSTVPAVVDATPIVNKERLQLMPEEALWLTFGMGVLRVKDPESGNILSSRDLLRLFRQYSYFPPRISPDDPDLGPDDNFLVHYAVYHHFRSLGWVPRGGIKFGVDWMLYTRGPAFDHAQFGLMVVPSYSDPWWKESGKTGSKRTWQWLHSVVRVLTHVYKSLVIIYVDVPPPPKFEAALDKGIAEALKLYKVREFPIKRWSPNRNR